MPWPRQVTTRPHRLVVPRMPAQGLELHDLAVVDEEV